MNRTLKTALLALALWPMMVPIGLEAQNVSPQAVRALYTVQMQKFVTLGKGERNVKTICYYEKHPVSAKESVGQQIEKYVKSNAAFSYMTVKKFKAVSDFSECDILYIPADDENELKDILVALGNSETLTVSAIPHFTVRGGMIGFVTDEQDRIRMEGNLKVAREKNVNIASKLLELMVRVIQ